MQSNGSEINFSIEQILSNTENENLQKDTDLPENNIFSRIPFENHYYSPFIYSFPKCNSQQICSQEHMQRNQVICAGSQFIFRKKL